MGGNIFQHVQSSIGGAFRPDLLPTGSVAADSTPTVYFDYASRSGSWTLTSGDLVAESATTTGTEAGIRLNTSFAAASGTYIEFYAVSGAGLDYGVGVSADGDSSLSAQWYTPEGCLYYSLNGLVYRAAGLVNSTLGSFGSGVTVGVCVKNGKFYVSKSGVWAGDPSAETGALYTGLSGNYWPAVYSARIGSKIGIRLSAADMLYPLPTGTSTLLP